LPAQVTPNLEAVRRSLALATLAAEVGAMPDGPHKEALKGMLRPHMPNNPLFDLPKGKDVFLVCQYGNTLVRFIQKMPKGLSTCRIGYSETLGHVQKVTCE
jgi:hypothetical protein